MHSSFKWHNAKELEEKAFAISPAGGPTRPQMVSWILGIGVRVRATPTGRLMGTSDLKNGSPGQDAWDNRDLHCVKQCEQAVKIQWERD